MRVDDIHGPLDRATRALGDLIDARVTGNEATAKDAIDCISTELGACKEALREFGMTARLEPEITKERILRMIEYASDLRAKAQQSMVTVASGALALSITFRGVLVRPAQESVWLLKASWIAFVLCVVFALAESFVTSRRLVVHAVEETAPSKREKWTMAALFLGSLLFFAIGIGTLAGFGLVNL